MKVLVACEFSGRVRDAFIKRGHDAYSCDLLPTEVPGPHYQKDIREVLDMGGWDLMVAHPPCTFLAVSGARWFKSRERANRGPSICAPPHGCTSKKNSYRKSNISDIQQNS